MKKLFIFTFLCITYFSNGQDLVNTSDWKIHEAIQETASEEIVAAEDQRPLMITYKVPTDSILEQGEVVKSNSEFS